MKSARDELDELLAYLTPAEAKELDAHLLALEPIRPHAEYRTRPVEWMVDKLLIPEHTIRWSLLPEYKGHIWDGTPDPLAAIAEAVASGRPLCCVGVESCTTSGKTFLAAALTYWFSACWDGARTFTYGGQGQLERGIWMEMGKLWGRFAALFPTASLTHLDLRMRGGMDKSWGAEGVPVALKLGEEVSTKASGVHAEHMLLIYEEMQGAHPSVVAAGEHACTAPHNIRLGQGNPNHQLDPLHKFSTDVGVTHIRISAFDHPNVVTGRSSLIAGAVSRESIDRRRAKFTEASPVFLSRVRGISPEQASDSLIRLEWLQRSAARWKMRKALTDALALGEPIGAGWIARQASMLHPTLARWVPQNAIIDPRYLRK